RSGRDRRAKEAGRSRAPASRPEVARPPKVTLRRPGDPGAPRCARSREGPPPPPQTDGPPPSRSAPSAPCADTHAGGRLAPPRCKISQQPPLADGTTAPLGG